MRNIRCADCGKKYDYDVDDFCPRCGSFNPPTDSGATRLEEEMLSRFQRPGSGGQTVRRAAPRPASGGRPVKKKGDFRRVETVLEKAIEAICDLIQAFR